MDQEKVNRFFEENDVEDETDDLLPEVTKDSKKWIMWLNFNTDYKRIVKFVAKKGASYPGEIARATFTDYGKVMKMIGVLESCGILKRAYPQWVFNDPRLLSRRSDMWSQGIKGLDKWSQLHWVVLSDELLVTYLWHGIEKGSISEEEAREMFYFHTHREMPDI